MEKEKSLPRRKPTRHKEFDYGSSGVYFITVCTEKRRPILSRIVGADPARFHDAVGADVLAGPHPELTPCGRIVDQYIRQLDRFYSNISVESYVIMPNHVHLLLIIQHNETPDGGPSGRSAPTVGQGKDAPPMQNAAGGPSRQHMAVPRFVSTLKRFCNKEYGENIFQRSFYDHVIRNDDDYYKTKRYILENPARWFYDELFAAEDPPNA